SCRTRPGANSGSEQRERTELRGRPSRVSIKLVVTLRGRSSVWLERRPVTSEVAGSNPVVPAIPSNHLQAINHERFRLFFASATVAATVFSANVDSVAVRPLGTLQG